MSRVKKKLPPDKIIVKNGQVVFLDKWTWWDLNPTIYLIVRRSIENSGNSAEFNVLDIEYFEGKTRPQTGKTIEEAANKAFSSEYANPLIALFNLENPTEDQVRQIHNTKDNGLEVIFQ